MMSDLIINNSIDDKVDEQIYECFDPNNPKSFFLFAGAGSGKTKSLVNVLSKFNKEFGSRHRLKHQKVAIITYTNAAADEIKHRLEFDSIFYVSTIHSFAWELIKSLTKDIKDWLELDLSDSIKELKEAQSKSKDLNNKASVDRARKIETKEDRLININRIKKFIYSPNGDNISKDSLNHTEVISITAHFIQFKILMQDIVVSKFPIILIDESQDTKKELIDAFYKLQENRKDNFSLGLFGDTMQRIYADGKEDLGRNLPLDWLQPVKRMNHRSNKRIINLINQIREDVDGQKQIPRSEKEDGVVRLFIANRNSEKSQTERIAKAKMSQLTKDSKWMLNDREVMTLILEHHMAAKRMNFLDFFEPLYKVDKLKTSLLDGSSSALNFFTKLILPLVTAYKKNDKFSIAQIIKKNCPLLDKKIIKESGNQADNFIIADKSVKKLLSFWDDNNDPKLIELLNVIKETSLLSIPSVLNIITSRTEDEKGKIDMPSINDEEDEGLDEVINAWDIALQAPFSQIENYNSYLSNDSSFATHQGVKGLEYSRVMVVIDDEEARGFMFSYDKLFGSKDLTPTDLKNMEEGRETGIDRTRRLFYVACSRAKESLAIIAYAANPEIVKKNAISYKWFDESEIEVLF